MCDPEFSSKWIRNLVDSLDKHLDLEVRVKLMELCGRACARGGASRAAALCRGNLDRLLYRLEEWIGKGNVQREGDLVRVVYPRCFCPMVALGPSRLPDTYCFCSLGWMKEMFETVLKRPVEVELHESIKRGGKCCRFTVHL